MKCDEEKPACLRCRSSGRTCDGYASKRPAPRTATIRTNGPNNPLTSPFTTVRELQSFRFFQEKTVPELLGYFDSNFWGSSVLQLGNSEPAIQHAIIALGAVHEQFQNAGLVAAGPTTEDDDARALFPLQQFDKAIQHLNKGLLAKGHQLIETALVCCILFVCYESIQGDQEAAFVHLQNGLNIFRERKHARHQDLEYDSVLTSDSSTLSNNLLRVFSCLDVQLKISLNDPLTQSITAPRVDSLTTNNPTSMIFASNFNSKETLDIITSRTYNFLISNCVYRFSPLGTVPPTVLIEYEAIALLLLEYTSSFTVFMDASNSSMSVEDLQTAVLLKIRQKVLSIMLTLSLVAVPPQSIHTPKYNILTDEFEAVISLVASVSYTFPPSIDSRNLPSTNSTSYLTSSPPTNLVAIPSHLKTSSSSILTRLNSVLHCVENMCRDSAVQERALALLQAISYQETIRKNLPVASILQRSAERSSQSKNLEPRKIDASLSDFKQNSETGIGSQQRNVQSDGSGLGPPADFPAGDIGETEGPAGIKTSYMNEWENRYVASWNERLLTHLRKAGVSVSRYVIAK